MSIFERIAHRPIGLRFDPLELLIAAADTARLWSERHLQRRALAELDRRLLDDIGVHPADARLESEKPFWRP